ncbi:hypothetical protein D3C72_1766280 [compost metagenome]
MAARTPWRTRSAPCSAGARSSQPSCHTQLTGVPETSVIPKTCSTSKPIASTAFSTASGGGEPAVSTRTGRGSRVSFAASASIAITTGAAQR